MRVVKCDGCGGEMGVGESRADGESPAVTVRGPVIRRPSGRSGRNSGQLDFHNVECLARWVQADQEQTP